MSLKASAVFRLELGSQSVVDGKELLKSKLLTMTVRLHHPLSLLLVNYKFCFPAMIIGFTERVRTVPEIGVDGFDLNQLLVAVATLRISERDHLMIFRYLESSSTAIVDPLDISTANFDVIFGIRDRPNNPIEVHLDLEAGESLIRPLFLSIRNDFVPEEEECFTLRIIPADVPGRDELFTCNEDGEGANNYYCEHTICIADDDG